MKYALENCPIFATVTDSATGITTTYDSIGRLIGCEKKVNGETVLRTWQEFNEHNQQTYYGYQMGDESYSESYTYNSDGTLNQIVGNDGRTVTMSYDELRRLSGKTVTQGDTTVVSYTYSYRNISETATTTQIASVQVTAADTVATYAYTYDSSGNILSVSDGTNTTSYVYDSMNQLVRENNQAADKTWTWVYDNAGNILSRSEYAYTTESLEGVTPADTGGYTYGDSNWSDLLTAYDGNTITYDEIGNPLNDGTWAYTWENGRQLASMTDGTTTWSYEYNADGLRTSRTDGTTTYQYVYNGGSLVQMTVGNDVLYFTSDTVTFNGVTYYYVKNLQGDVIGIVDSSGATVATYVYDAWGNILSTSGELANTLGELNPLRYRGYVYDAESELYYLQSRYYDPELGRFLNADAFASTGQGILGNNMFAYCGNNPAIRRDPSGHFWGLILPIIVTVDDIKQLVDEEESGISSSYTPNNESVQISNSVKIKTPWVQFGYSFYLNHFSEYSEYFSGTTAGMTFEWTLHNLGAYGFKLLGYALDAVGKDGEKFYDYSARCESVDLGPTIYHDDPSTHGSFSYIMKTLYVLTSTTTAAIDALAALVKEMRGD